MSPPSSSHHRWWERLNQDWQEPGNLDVTLRRIAEVALEAFEADFCLMYAINPLTGVFVPTPGKAGSLNPSDQPEPVKTPRKHGLTRRVIEQGYLEVENSALLPEDQAGFCRRQGISSFAAVALHTFRKPLPFAVLYVDYRRARSFDQSFESNLKSFARLASHKLQATWFLRRYQRIAVIGQQINQSLETEAQLFRELTSRVGSIIDTSRCFILAFYRQEDNRLGVHSFIDGKAVAVEDRPVNRKTQRLLRRKSPLQIRSLRDETAGLLREVEGFSTNLPWNPESLLFVPLVLEGRSLGVLSVQHPEPDAYDDEDRHLLALLGSHVALAMANLRLFGHLQRLLKAGQTLTRKLETEGVLEAIVEAIRDTTGCDIAVLYPYVGAAGSFNLPPRLSGTLKEPDFPQPQYVEPSGISYSILHRTEPLYAEDAGELLNLVPTHSEGDAKPGFQQREGIQSVAALPLRAGNEPVGVLFLNYRVRQQFRADPGIRYMIEGLAGYAAISIKNARLLGEERGRHVKNLEILGRFDRELNKSNDLKELLDKILELAAGRLEEEGRRPDEASVLLYNRERDELVTRAAIGPNRERSLLQVLRPSDEKGITLQVLKTGRSVLVEDVQTSRWGDRYLAVGTNTRSELDVPLLDGEEVVGILNLESSKPGAFQKPDMDLMEVLAGQAVLAVKKAQAHDKEKRLREDEETLLDLAKELTQRLDTEELLDMIVERAIDKTRAQAGVLVLVEPPGGNLTVKAERGVEGPQPRIGRRLQRGEGILGYVAEHGKAVNADLREEPWKSLHLPVAKGMLSELAIPLKLRGEVRGVLNVESSEARFFNPSNERLIAGLADLALIALQNAERFESAQRRRERFQLLYKAGQELAQVSNLADISSAYSAVVDIASKHLESLVVVRRLDLGGEWLVREASSATDGPEPYERISTADPLNGFSVREGKTLTVDDAENPPKEIGPFERSDPRDRSFLVAPIKFGQDRYGTLALSHPTVGQFKEGERQLVEALAQQLAITIHRLDEVSRRREADRRFLEAEAMSEIGRETYEIMHRLGNDLGLVPKWLRQLRSSAEPLPPEGEKLFDKSQNKVVSVLEFSRRLGDELSKLGPGGRLEPARSVTPVGQLLDEALDGLSLDERQGIEVRTNLGAGAGSVLVDPRQVVNALLNLLSNARDAMAGGGVLTLSARRVVEGVEVRVSDTGGGVDPADEKNLYRLGFTTKKKGTGFGLWSARKTLRANFGKISHDNRPGEGLTFIITLPPAGEPPHG